MLTTRDAIGGFWDGSKDDAIDPNELLKNLDDAENYLMHGIRASYRSRIVFSMLCGMVSVEGVNGTAQLKVGSKKFSKIERPGSEYFKEDLKWVRAYADLRGDRLSEIHLQLGDLLSFFGSIHYLDDGRRQHTLMLLGMARGLAIHVETQMKFHCRSPRPVDFAPQVQPMIQTPDHSSYPSGHAMESFAVATVLHRLQSGKDAQAGISDRAHPFRLAHRIATNRTVAGVHFPVDSLAGAWVGCHVGELVYALASGQEIWHKDLTLKPVQDARPDDEHGVFTRTDDFALASLKWNGGDSKMCFDVLEPLAHIWDKAALEWPGKPAEVTRSGSEAAPTS